MALTQISSPQNLTSAYNQMVFCVDSTNKNQLSFRYVFRIYNQDTAELLATLRVAPEPEFGYGYCDISKIINTQLTYNLDINNVINFEAPNNYIAYQVDVTEEYLYSWDFTSITFTPGTGLFTLVGSTPSVWNNNDEITIIVATGETEANGKYIVDSTPGNNTIVLGEYSGITGTATGTAYWANNTKTIGSTLTQTDFYAFNGAFSFEQYLQFNGVTYTIHESALSTTKKLLTDLPSTGFTITEDQDLWLSFFRDPTTFSQTIQFRIQNSDGDIFFNAASFSSATSLETSFNASPSANVFVLSGSLPIVKPTTTYYDVWLAEPSGLGGNQLTQKYRINIDTRCKIEDYEILFQDRMGSWLSYAFQLRAKETGSIERKTYNKVLGTIDTINGWEYGRQDAGQTIYNVNTNKELELNTNWMNDEMSVLFEQLLTSPVTLLKDVDGIYTSVIVQDNGFETLRQKNKNLIKKSIKVRFANINNINV